MTGPRQNPSHMVARDARDARVEQMVGRLLRLGVLFAALVVAIGGALLLVQYGHNPASFHDFTVAGSGLRSGGAILTGVSHGDSRAIAQLDPTIQKLISEEQFNSMFPGLPQLPTTAFQRHLE